MKHPLTKTSSSSASISVQARRRSSLLIAVGLLIGSLLVLAFVVVPQTQQAWSLYQKTQKKQDDIAKLQAKLRELDSVTLTGEYVSSRELVESVLPEKKPLLEVLTSLDQVRRASNVELSDLTTSPGLLASGSASPSRSQSSEQQALSLSFTVAGTYDQVSQFMELIEKTAPFTTIKSFKISEQNGTRTARNNQLLPTNDDLLRVSMESDTYFAVVNVTHNSTAPIPQLSNQSTAVLNQLRDFATIALPEQREVQGGGLEDLFGLPGIGDL